MEFSIETGLVVLAAFLASQLIHVLYPATRPFVELHRLPLVPHVHDLSFPSDHATFGFAIGVTLLLRCGASGLVACAIATCVGAMRILTLLHWPSDVLGGALVGTASAVGVLWIRKTFDAQFGTSGLHALFEKDDNFRKLIALLRYLAMAGLVFRFSAYPNVLEMGFRFQLPFLANHSHVAVIGICCFYFVFIVLTNRTAYRFTRSRQLTADRGQPSEFAGDRSRSLRFAIVGDFIFYSMFYALTGKVESNLFVLLLLPLVAASLFLNFTSVVKALAVAVGLLAVSIAFVATTTAPQSFGLDGQPEKQWLALNVFLPKGFALFLAVIPIGWLIERHSKLHDAKARYESLVEHIPQMITRKNLDGVITFANNAFCRLNGLEKAVIEGMTDFDLYREQYAKAYRAGDRQVIDTKQIIPIDEKHIPYGSSEEIDVEGCKIPVCDTNGDVIEIQIIFWDVTDRKKRQAQLERDSYLIDGLMDAIPDSIYFKDLDSRFTRINRHLAKRFGLENPDQARGKTDFDFFMPEHANAAREMELGIIVTGVPKENILEWEVYKGDGRSNVVTSTKLPLREKSGGTIIGTFGISRDIGALLEAQEKYRSIVENASEVIYTRTQDGNFLSLNQAGQRLLGFSEEEFKKRTLLGVVTDDSQAAAQQLLQTQRSTETRVALTVVAKNGRKINMEFSGFTIQGPGGELVTVGIGYDVTALQRTIDERTRLLQETHHRAKGNLERVSSALKIRARRSRDQELPGVLAEVQAQIVSMAEVHKRLMLDPTSPDLSAEEYVKTITKSVLELFKSQARGVQLAFEVENIKLHHSIIMDCGQIIVELITNALKYAFPNGRTGTITISLRRVGSSRFMLGVTDDGVGLPADIDPESTRSLGILLVRRCACLSLKGTFKCNRDSGTSFIVEF